MFQARRMSTKVLPSSAFEASGRGPPRRRFRERGRGLPPGAVEASLKAAQDYQAKLVRVLPGDTRTPNLQLAQKLRADPVARGFHPKTRRDRAHARPHHRPHDRTGERTRRGEPSGHAKRCRRACSPWLLNNKTPSFDEQGAVAGFDRRLHASDCRMSLMGPRGTGRGRDR